MVQSATARATFLSIITLAEIKKGIYKIKFSQPERSEKLQQWLNNIEVKFSPRILPITEVIPDNWAEITANAELQGNKLAVMDSFIAATAYHHQLILVTRNVDDFKTPPLKLSIHTTNLILAPILEYHYASIFHGCLINGYKRA